MKLTFVSSKIYMITISLITLMLYMNIYIINNVFVSKIFLLLVFIMVAFDAIVNYQKKFILFIFLITFFVFTMGQYYLGQNEVGIYYNQYSTETILTTIFMQGLALMFLYLGGRISVPKYFSHKLNKKNEVNVKFKQIIKYLFLFFFTISVISNLEIGIRVWRYGYLVIYNQSVASFIPEIIHYLAQFFPLIFFFNVSFNYHSENLNKVLGIYFIYLCMTLLTGVRGEFAIGLLMILLIFIKKQLTKIKLFDLIKSNIKIIFVFFIILILFIIGLNLYNSFRVSHEFKSFNPLLEINNFFVNQSTSVNVISYSIEFKKQLLAEPHLYTLGPVLENLASKLHYFNLNLDLSTFNTSLAKEVSILALGESAYMSGMGVGSQYLAELYLEGGTIAICMFNFLLGFFMKVINNFHEFNAYVCSISLFLLSSLLYIPRGQAFQFINALLSLNFIVALFILIMLNVLLNKRERKRGF